MSLHARHLQFHVDEEFKFKHLMQDRILVKPLKDPAATIIQFDSERNKPTRGFVVAVGPGKIDGKGRRHPLDVKEGDTILFGQHAVVEIFYGQEKLLITREENVFGVCQMEDIVYNSNEQVEIGHPNGTIGGCFCSAPESHK